MPRIEIEHLSVTYLGKKKQEYPALKDVSCIFPSGQISAIMGGSGSGKTSLFRALTSQLAYDGVIRSDGIDISTLTPKGASSCLCSAGIRPLPPFDRL